jgi:DNA-directed RNA polymerase subunit RPC12/RpoP
MKCACCGAEMLSDKELEKTVIYKCKECGLSDSKLKDIG